MTPPPPHHGPPRLLVIIGSGETSPGMVSAHSAIFRRLEGADGADVLLDTPAGFQENCDQTTADAVDYFRTRVGRRLEVAGYRRATGGTVLERETTFARVRAARSVFSGPGSPSYALAQWRQSALPDVLRDKLRRGGAVVFASAAAACLGRFVLPVYEIYKAGADPYWLDGLDLIAEAGLPAAAVVPHYNNAEGGTHDTRRCYIGERRLALLEGMLPTGGMLLGVDEHTMCIIDLQDDTLSVRGRGSVTIRRQGRRHVLPAKSVVALETVRRHARGTRLARPQTNSPSQPDEDSTKSPGRAFDIIRTSLDEGDIVTATSAALQLEATQARAEETGDRLLAQSARRALRSVLVTFAEFAGRAMHDHRDIIRPYVEAVVGVRTMARTERRWDDADSLRTALAAAGVAIQDNEHGTTWEFAEAAGARPG